MIVSKIGAIFLLELLLFENKLWNYVHFSFEGITFCIVQKTNPKTN